MPNLIKHKRVEFTELFYDLVFVYAISRTTALIHHLHHGIVTWETFSIFLLTLLTLVNTWMIQTVFTNRYGRNSLLNIVALFTNMGIMLFTTSMIITENWQPYFHLFCLVTGTLSLTLFLQYLAQLCYRKTTSEDKNLIKKFLIIIGIRTGMTYLAAFFPITTGQPIFVMGIVGTFLLPIVFGKGMNRVPINLPHLIERVSLLVIITFGEMILGIANFFTPETFTGRSVCYFLITVLLFLYYFGQFDHAIDEAADTQGLHLIYSHYPIFIGLIMTTVSFSFLTDPKAHKTFVVLFLYAGLALFQWAVLSNGRHNKDYLRYPSRYYLIQAMLFAIALLASLLFAYNSNLVTYITTSFLFAIETQFISFYNKQSKIHRNMQFEWF